MKPYDLVIATATYFGVYRHVTDPNYRRKLWTGFQDSLNATDFRGMRVLLYVCDDGSPQLPNMSRFQGDFEAKLVAHVPFGVNPNIVKMLNTVTDVAPLCLIADSDAYFDPHWMEWLRSALGYFPDAAGYSLFNSPRHQTYVRNLHVPGVIEKKHSPAFGLVYRPSDRPPDIEPPTWLEDFIGTLPEKHGMGFVVPKISMIQHAGCYGINNVPGGSQDYDPLFPLNHQCGLADWTDRTGFEDVQFEKEKQHA